MFNEKHLEQMISVIKDARDPIYKLVTCRNDLRKIEQETSRVAGLPSVGPTTLTTMLAAQGYFRDKLIESRDALISTVSFIHEMINEEVTDSEWQYTSDIALCSSGPIGEQWRLAFPTVIAGHDMYGFTTDGKAISYSLNATSYVQNGSDHTVIKAIFGQGHVTNVCEISFSDVGVDIALSPRPSTNANDWFRNALDVLSRAIANRNEDYELAKLYITSGRFSESDSSIGFGDLKAIVDTTTAVGSAFVSKLARTPRITSGLFFSALYSISTSIRDKLVSLESYLNDSGTSGSVPAQYTQFLAVNLGVTSVEIVTNVLGTALLFSANAVCIAVGVVASVIGQAISSLKELPEKMTVEIVSDGCYPLTSIPLYNDFEMVVSPSAFLQSVGYSYSVDRLMAEYFESEAIPFTLSFYGTRFVFIPMNDKWGVACYLALDEFSRMGDGGVPAVTTVVDQSYFESDAPELVETQPVLGPVYEQKCYLKFNLSYKNFSTNYKAGTCQNSYQLAGLNDADVRFRLSRWIAHIGFVRALASTAEGSQMPQSFEIPIVIRRTNPDDVSVDTFEEWVTRMNRNLNGTRGYNVWFSLCEMNQPSVGDVNRPFTEWLEADDPLSMDKLKDTCQYIARYLPAPFNTPLAALSIISCNYYYDAFAGVGREPLWNWYGLSRLSDIFADTYSSAHEFAGDCFHLGNVSSDTFGYARQYDITKNPASWWFQPPSSNSASVKAVRDAVISLAVVTAISAVAVSVGAHVASTAFKRRSFEAKSESERALRDYPDDSVVKEYAWRKERVANRWQAVSSWLTGCTPTATLLSIGSTGPIWANVDSTSPDGSSYAATMSSVSEDKLDIIYSSIAGHPIEQQS